MRSPDSEVEPANCVIKNSVDRARKEALEKGAKDEVDNGREESLGT